MGHTATTGYREYETIYVLRPTVDNNEAEKINTKVADIVQQYGGKLTKLDNWGRRRLAYPIRRFTRGLFVYTKYVGPGSLIQEVERNLRINDAVLRQQTLLLRRDVATEEVEVDPDELKFAPIEPAEEEEELNLEQRLGLAPREPVRKAGDQEQEASASDDKEAASETKKTEAADEPKQAEASSSNQAEASSSNQAEGGQG